MEKKHTPGPWQAQYLYNEIAIQSTRPTGLGDLPEITCIPYGSTVIRDAEAEANAQLIAAAPELLKALEMILQMLEHQERDACRGFGEFSRVDFEAQPQIKELISAIKKARGES